MIERLEVQCEGDGCDVKIPMMINYPQNANILFGIQIALCAACSRIASLELKTGDILNYIEERLHG